MEKLSDWLSFEMKADNKAEINVFGYIGVPEIWQHDTEMADKVTTTKEKMRTELERVANLKADTIEVNIDSFGGDVNHGFAIYNALMSNKAKIIVNYVGWSASVATVIGAAGQEVNAPENFMGLLHETRGIVMGTTESVETYSRELKKLNLQAANIYSIKSGKEAGEMLSIMAENKGEGEWKTATELKEIGLIDNIYEPVKAAASYEDMTNKAKQFGLNYNFDMSLFKNTKQVNKLELGEFTAVYEGELKAGVKLAGIGEEVTDGTYELEGKSITIEKSIVKSVEDKAPEMVALSEMQEKINEATTTLNAEVEQLKADLEAKTAEFDELKENYDNLAELSSDHKPQKGNGVENPAQEPVDFQLSVEQSVDEITAGYREKFEEKRKN